MCLSLIPDEDSPGLGGRQHEGRGLCVRLQGLKLLLPLGLGGVVVVAAVVTSSLPQQTATRG